VILCGNMNVLNFGCSYHLVGVFFIVAVEFLPIGGSNYPLQLFDNIVS
jgi:hypothetical protein